MRRTSTTWTIGAGITLLGALIALGLLTTRAGVKPAGSQGDPGQAAEFGTIVDIAPVTVGPVVTSLTAVGTLQAVASIIIRPELAGIVRRVHFTDGNKVEEGAVLLELDQEELRAQTSQAAAQEKIARLTHERLKRLGGQQTTIVSPHQIDEAKSALQAAEANTILYSTRLKKTTLRAPFSGTLGIRRVSVGDFVQPGQDIVNLEDLRILHVDFKVPEVWLSRLAVHQRLDVVTTAYPDQRFSGEVSVIDPRVDPVNRSVWVRAKVENVEGRLRPGLFATVTLVLAETTQALLIPEEAVIPDQDKTHVYRVIENTAQLTEVTLGKRDRGLVQVLGGLQAHERVVRAGHQKLKDGDRVVPER